MVRSGGEGHQARRHEARSTGARNRAQMGEKIRASRVSDGAVAFGVDARVVDLEDT